MFMDPIWEIIFFYDLLISSAYSTTSSVRYGLEINSRSFVSAGILGFMGRWWSLGFIVSGRTVLIGGGSNECELDHVPRLLNTHCSRRRSAKEKKICVTVIATPFTGIATF